ncbi:MAG: winged helix-turn-helix domain-containing protein [Clostridiales bacterium]|nr:winged helix-turn-helix domain-containing protein [Clostridiales bacterium]
MIELLQEDPGYTYAKLAENLSVSRKTVSERKTFLSIRSTGISIIIMTDWTIRRTLEAWRHPVIMDLAFGDDFGFGF